MIGGKGPICSEVIIEEEEYTIIDEQESPFFYQLYILSFLLLTLSIAVTCCRSKVKGARVSYVSFYIGPVQRQVVSR
jgi:hypothetical protein